MKKLRSSWGESSLRELKVKQTTGGCEKGSIFPTKTQNNLTVCLKGGGGNRWWKKVATLSLEEDSLNQSRGSVEKRRCLVVKGTPSSL